MQGISVSMVECTALSKKHRHISLKEEIGVFVSVCSHACARVPVCPYSLEWRVEADGGGAVEDDVDAAAEHLHVLRAEGQAGLGQLAAHRNDLLVEVGVLLPHARKQLGTGQRHV